MDENEALAKRGEGVLVPNYRPAPIALVRGEGCHLFDAEGRQYLDLMGGIATAVLGHCHPKVVAALEEQAHSLWHVSNLFTTKPQVELAERLTRHSFAERIYFGNSGAEANEAALKLSRRWHRDRGDDRFEIIAFDGAFHGRTLFTVSATGTPAYWQGFEPLVPGVHHAPFGDLEAVMSLLSQRTAAIIVEPVQGEGGVRTAPEGFLRGLRELADQNGCLLIFDEVQTGIGRTGPLFAYQTSGVVPDVMTLAKALGNGIPIGAMCTTTRFAEALVPGTHASTFGGNPLAAACATVVLDELCEGGVLERAQPVGDHLGAGLEAIAQRFGPQRIIEARGAGHLRALELNQPVAPIVARCREKGVLVIQAGEMILRLAPPLVITREQVDEGLSVIEEALHEIF
ncbi:MAG: aspartate aminotransferase family protein [Deltaproteobacteria bacterium]|nr:aspartate aminotransferase family protein [Deltaproteobacteria bacterium]MBW2382942.1 aspartate aminotransferase family protein [Deltaproteobacteria bacterium]